MTDTQEWLFRIGILVAGAILIFAILWIGRPTETVAGPKARRALRTHAWGADRG
jgi:hypothetical protein